MKTGLQLIAEERMRQIEAEGYDAQHDDGHYEGEIYRAAWCYGSIAGIDGKSPPPKAWPWSAKWWKPSDDEVRNLVKSGALMRAEIDRLERLCERTAAAIDRRLQPVESK